MILRTCVVIPCFDHPRTISSVLKDVVNKTAFPILVVDDGSETPVTNVLYSFEVRQALEQGRIRVVRFDENRGKGAALRYAIQDLVTKGFTHMLTMDGDGRQMASEIVKLTQLAAQHPWDLIIGNRNMKTDPPTRFQRLSRKVVNFCVRFETGEALKDVRSSFRLYPLFSLQMMRIRRHRYDWELEALIRLLWNGVGVQEVDIETAEYNPSEHNVHYRLKDSLRLWTLNFMLIMVSLVRTRATPRELGLSMAIGVWIGATPAFGFHSLIVVALAFIFPLNFLAMYLGTHIALPMFVPFLMVTEVYIGQHWLGIPTSQGLMGHWSQWVAGSAVLGVILGLPAGVFTYWAVKEAQNPEAAADLTDAQTRRHRTFKFISDWFGRVGARAAVPVLVMWRYLVRMRARRGLFEFYRVMMPGQRFWLRQWHVIKHLHTVTSIQADLLSYRAGKFPGLRVHDDGNLPASRTPVVITAHFGAWDLAATALTPAPTMMYGDRASGNRYELIPFMGRLAPFDVTPLKQATGAQAPLAFSVGLRAEDGTYELYSRPPAHYEFRKGTAEELQVLEMASRFVRQLEFYVRKYPEQWSNLYPFWSSLPPKHDAHSGVFMEDLEMSLVESQAIRPAPLR